MKKLFLIILLLAFNSTLMFPQMLKFGYSYDANGNRTSRYQLPWPRIQDPNIFSNKPNDSTLFLDYNLQVYPNPNQGSLNITINGYIEGESVAISIYDVRNRMIFNQIAYSSTININISDERNGIYCLKIIYKNKEVRKLIIKE